LGPPTNPIISAKSAGGVAPPNRLLALLRRRRFQLGIGLVLSLILPYFLRFRLTVPEPIEQYIIGNTALGIVIAVLGGYYALVRMSVLPGVRAVSYVLPIFGMSYLIVFAVFLFLRLDYGRFQLALGFAISAVWFVFVTSVAQKINRQRLGLIPIGQTLGIVDLPGIDWHILTGPKERPLGFNGIVVDLRAEHPADWQHFITESVLAGIPVFHVKQVQESVTGRVEIDHLSENTLGSLNPNDAYLRTKALVDRLIAAIFLVLAAPFLLLVGLAIRLESKGPALFRQSRVGYGGKVFTIYKFRTMVEAEEPTNMREAAKTRTDDERITRLGRFLRRTRIDELPQAINILRGEMSWIGPRPEAVPLSKWYENELPFYRYRHIVRPGISGWAQVHQGHVAEVDEVLEKLHFDFYYIKNFSLWMDALIVMKTIHTMATGFGAR
jgi:lipopolysaccharide/colanic/teichoic acid biosynthesis glycosyltransferase